MQALYLTGDYSIQTPQKPDNPQQPEQPVPAPKIGTINIAYRQPGEKTTSRLAYDIFLEKEEKEIPSNDFNFSAAVAQFGMLLKNPEFARITDLKKILQLAIDAIGEDRRGYRSEFIKILKSYKTMTDNKNMGEE